MLTRQKEFLQWIVGGVSTSALIVGGVWMSDHRDTVMTAMTDSGMTSGSRSDSRSDSRSMASEIPPSKIEVLEKHADAAQGPANKASGNMQLTLTSPEGRRSDGSLLLDAQITATMDLTDLKYEWVLPDGVSLLSGNARGDIGTLAQGDSSALEVSLSVLPQTDGHVHLHVYREVAGERVGQVAQYNVLNQEAVDVKLASKRESLLGEASRKPAAVQQQDNRRME